MAPQDGPKRVDKTCRYGFRVSLEHGSESLRWSAEVEQTTGKRINGNAEATAVRFDRNS